MPVDYLVLSICKSTARTDPLRQLQNKRLREMDADPGGFNRSTQHLLILRDEEVFYGSDGTDVVFAAAKG
jgi:hypothetical protein